ncbi:MAG: TetR/AcrR family transcriptional regulator [Pseudomonadota bacterium]
MNMTTVAAQETSNLKGKYHHGDLRQTLIAASYDLVNAHGADTFSLADACRLANVSTAAPYRHFKDRDEILAEVTARGFEAMTAKAVEAVEAAGEGTLEGITAMGQAYLDFATSEEGVFRLMFGGAPALEDSEMVMEMGTNCFGYLIQQITAYCSAQGLEQDADAVAVKMWTFVHGASALLMDQKYEKVTPGLDVKRMIAEAVPLLMTKPD